MTETLITTNEICEKYRISKGMVHKLRQSGLPHITIGRCIRYSLTDVAAWIAQRQGDTDHDAMADNPKAIRQAEDMDDNPPQTDEEDAR